MLSYLYITSNNWKKGVNIVALVNRFLTSNSHSDLIHACILIVATEDKKNTEGN